MRNRMHPQDIIPLVVGIYAALAPIWTTTTTKATWTMVVLGVVTAVLALVEMFRPDMMSVEGLMAVMGVLFFIAPWVMGFSDLRAMSWTAWIAGVVTVVVGAADLQVTRSHRGGMAAQH
ncbi:SPW repeat protein [Phycicoccus sp. M110.8]|uniref:SPW repeat protein n=1 Tax=Phycicoccus sp. M110.8 TaxID=3075433 RepID=UPI0028FD748A|nr:SPW repeat protein [Phycicoccus sp. M110.8]MDU0313954.1 SPW repeat protein [Phycicoccus sp. M110.8]